MRAGTRRKNKSASGEQQTSPGGVVSTTPDTRHQIFSDSEIAAQNIPLFGGLTEDRYVSTFLDPGVYHDGRARRRFPIAFPPLLRCFESVRSARTRTNESRLQPCCSDLCRMRVTRCRREAWTHFPIQASIAQIDASVVLNRDGTLLAFGAILRHRPRLDESAEAGEGGRTAAAIEASHFANVLMMSEGGQVSFYQKGHCIWTI
jgi:hypothetical protein